MGLLQDHCLEDDEPLQVPPSVPHPEQLSPQRLNESSPDFPAWHVIAPRWHDRKVTPPRLPHLVVADAAVEVCARVGVDPVSVDLSETDVLRGRGVTRPVPLFPFPIRRFCCLADGKREKGDEPVYTPTPEDICLW